MKKISPFLLFQTGAEDAMNYYCEVFGAEITVLQKYGEADPGETGTVERGAFKIKNLEIYCTDSITPHEFDFTPSSSFFIDFDSEDEMMTTYQKILEEGSALMEAGNYGFSKQFAWVQDKFKVSWQLNVPL